LGRVSLVVDSSVLIALSRSGDLEASLRRRVGAGYAVVVPGAVFEEVADEPMRLAEEIAARSPALAEKIRSSAECIRGVFDAGLVRVVEVDYRRYSKVLDGVRRYLGVREGTPEHDVGKGDPELVALVSQVCGSGGKVVVATQDKGLRRVLGVFLADADFDFIGSL